MNGGIGSPYSSFFIPHSSGGFTVLELLVASLLLGMLMTILTMIFSQSSIAWRTGVAGVSDMSDARTDVSALRYGADNVYFWDGEKCVRSVFGPDGEMVQQRLKQGDSASSENDSYLLGQSDMFNVSQSTDPDRSYGIKPVRTPGKNGSPNYVVNVRSWGPDRKEGTRYDNVYSVSPTDDPGEW